MSINISCDVYFTYIQSGHTILHTATLKRDVNIVKYLIEHGADVEATAKDVKTLMRVYTDICDVYMHVCTCVYIYIYTHGYTHIRTTIYHVSCNLLMWCT